MCVSAGSDGNRKPIMRILHVFRSPVGGLFRHVRDLARGQAALGHEVGIFCDSSTGGRVADTLLEEAQLSCSLGIRRHAISKLPGLGDISTSLAVRNFAKHLNVDIIHGHGAKGGLYGRLAGKLASIPSIYTPHGGSLHYAWSEFPGCFFLLTERALAHAGSGFIFVCEFEKNLFSEKIGVAGRPVAVVHNGLWPEEFKAPQLEPDATDLLFVGEMRTLKGVDILLQALALLRKQKPVTLTLVGDGPQQTEFETLAQQLDLGMAARFAGRHAMSAALKMGKIMVLPSRNESFPYVVLESVAAGVPIIATNVGGIGEILPPTMMCQPNNSAALAEKILHMLSQPTQTRRAATGLANTLADSLSTASMTQKVVEFYQSVTGR